MGFNGDLMGFNGDYAWLPCGKRLQQNYGKIHHAGYENWTIHYFDWVIFYVANC